MSNFDGDITEESIDQANTLLGTLTSFASSDWDGTLQAICSDSEYALNIKNIENALKELHQTGPIGLVVGSTAYAKELSGLPGEEAQRAIRILKLSNRIIQAGKGRGKGIIVVSNKPLSLQEFSHASEIQALRKENELLKQSLEQHEANEQLKVEVAKTPGWFFT